MSVFNHTIFHNSIKLIENQLKEHGIEKDESMFENNLIKKLLDHDWSLLEALKAEELKNEGVGKKEFLKKIGEHFFTKEEIHTNIYDYELPDWLNDSKNTCEELRFKSYKNQLIEKNMGGIVEQLDSDLNFILNKCHSPHVKGKWDRRGLVYGHVQSGKTANYVGLINRAFDHGYKIIIVLTGMTEDLRKQTQARVDQGVRQRIRKGNDKVNRGTNPGETVTTSRKSTLMSGDLGRRTLNAQLHNISHRDKSIWVIKKNKTVLESLIVWFYEQIQKQGGNTLVNCPVLIIDDEADNASIQSLTTKEVEEWEEALKLRKKDEVDLSDTEKETLRIAQEENVIKAINRNIRVLLSLIDQKTFVGYTATPYNIVVQESEDIDHLITIKHPIHKTEIDLKITAPDLFPEHFIVPINPGKPYLGIERLFNEDDNKNIPAVINLDEEYDEDYELIFPTKRGEEYDFVDLPKSLKDSIYYYIVSIIIKNHRNIIQHNTMLIHTSHLTKNADYVANEVSEFISEIREAAVAADENILLKMSEVLSLIKINSSNKLYKDYFNLKPLFPDSITFQDILDVVRPIKNSFEVISYHSSRDSKLKHKFHDINYGEKKADDGEGKKFTNYIVIGGNRLSRGLTLEGLIVSYFIRSSTRQDSLYQMGRWFGYRIGYEDLVRIMMPNDHILWYNSIYRLEMTLRNDFESYNDPEAPQMPRNALIKLSYEINIEQLQSNKKFPSICDPSKLKKTRVGTVSHEGSKYISSVWLTKKISINNLKATYKLFDGLYKNEKDKLFDNETLPDKWKEKKSHNNISFTKIPQKYILEFFKDFNFHPDIFSDVKSFVEFIEKNENKVNNWSVSLVNKGTQGEENPYDISKFNRGNNNLLFVERNSKKNKNLDNQGGYKINPIIDANGKDTSFDIINNDNVGEFNMYSNNIYNKYRKESKNPLMVIYPSKTKYKDEKIEHPLIYLYYPRIEGLKKVKYIIKKDYD